MPISGLTKQYWLGTFDEWAESRLSAPQYDEAHQVLVDAGLIGVEQDGWIGEGIPRFVVKSSESIKAD